MVAIAVLCFSAVAGVPAWSDPELQIDLSVASSAVESGGTLAVTATSNVPCAWTLTWRGRTRRRSTGPAPFRATYKAPDVDRITKIPLHAACSHRADPIPGNPHAQHPWRTTRTILITTVPPQAPSRAGGQADSQDGLSAWLIAIGLGLCVLGRLIISRATNPGRARR